MHGDLHVVALMVVSGGAGWLMIEAGVLKNMLERRRDSRVCPSCGRRSENCGCR